MPVKHFLLVSCLSKPIEDVLTKVLNHGLKWYLVLNVDAMAVDVMNVHKRYKCRLFRCRLNA